MTSKTTHRGNRRSDAASVESDQRLSAAFHVSPIGNALLRMHDAVIVEINDAYLKIFGCTREEVVGQPVKNLPFLPREPVREATERAFREGAGFSDMEVTFMRRDGSTGQGLLGNHPLMIDGALYALSTLIDISERKQMEQSLRDSRERLQAAIAGGGLGTWIWDIAKGEMHWDAAAYEVWGRASEQAETIPLNRLMEFVHPDDRPRVSAATEKFLRTGVDDVAEFRSFRPDGALQWLISKGRVERDAEGRPVRMTGVVLDITARKRAEETLMRSQKMEALGTLAGGIAHDFNNLLTSILGNARLAITELAGEHPAQESLREVARAGARAADLVNRILTFSRRQESDQQVVQLQPIVEEALSLLRPMAPTSIEITKNFAADTPAVNVDPTQVHQIVMNLVTNAVQAIGQRAGRIEVELDKVDICAAAASGTPDLHEGPYARLSVHDNGCGMDAADLDQIFDPFFTTKPVGEGAGLGLSVVHGIVKSCGGALSVTSERDKGATFHLWFPASEPQETPPVNSPLTESRGHGQRILYVDDEESLVFLAQRMLDRLGYRVTGFSDPQQALAAFRENPASFDAVVTDLAMRGMSGFELAEALLAIRADTPIVMTSGYVRPADREAATRCGVREFISKPDNLEELAGVLNRLFAPINGG